MEATRMKKWLSFLLCIVLIAAMALVTTGCGGSEPAEEESPSVSETGFAKDGDLLGEGETEFPITIADKDGNEIAVTIRTDKTIVGEALQELGLIEGEEGPYGLYIKSVNGIRADYDKDKVYWAFYINGDYAVSGVDVTEIRPGDTYALKVEKG